MATQATRRSEGHVAVAFGDGTKTGCWQELRAFLNDRDVSKDCTEANATEGWVMLIEGPRRTPRKVYGAVRIEGILRAKDADHAPL